MNLALALAFLIGASPLPPCSQHTCTVHKRLGCFVDHNSKRILNEINMSSPSLTPSACFSFCGSQGYPLAGLEDGRQCFCGKRLSSTAQPLPQQQCDMACGGNASATCGAPSRLDVFNASCSTERLDLPFCRSNLPLSQRIDDLLGRLSLEEKVACMGTKTCTIPRFGLGMSWKESLHGLRYPCSTDLGVEPVCATSFPHAQLLAATFDRSIWAAVGLGISEEGRAFYNLHQDGKTANPFAGALSFFAPDINLCRDPRWGRCLEVPGEDPLLTSTYAVDYVRAMQESDEKGFMRSICNAKHFSAYDVEHDITNTYNRGSFNAVVPERDLVETYWPQFRAASRAASLGGVMCSYNAVNGVPSCANNLNNNLVLRGELGFDGMIVSDCSAVVGIETNHHYTNSSDATCRAAVQGGCDLNCGSFYEQHLASSVETKAVGEDDVDRAVRRVLKQLFETGQVEADRPFSDLGLSTIDSSKHRFLARRAAAEGMVLLKNDGTLPLRSGTKVAILGPHFNSSTHLLANYYGDNNLVETSTPLLGLQRNAHVEVVGAAAGVSFDGNDVSGIDDAVAIANEADVSLLFVGLHSSQGSQENNTEAMEREGWDRHSLELPGKQLELITAVAATGKPVVCIYINSGGLDAGSAYKTANATLEAYYPGELGGDALADVLTGLVSPSGRLVTTIYSQDFAESRNITDMEMRAHGKVPGVTYRFIDEKYVLFSFGSGLTYTEFDISLAGPSSVSAGARELVDTMFDFFLNSSSSVISFRVAVKNVGRVASKISVLAMASSGRPEDPQKQLAGFAKTELPVPPGGQAILDINIAPQALFSVDASGTEALQPGTYIITLGGDDLGTVAGRVHVTGEEQVVFTMPDS